MTSWMLSAEPINGGQDRQGDTVAWGKWIGPKLWCGTNHGYVPWGKMIDPIKYVKTSSIKISRVSYLYPQPLIPHNLTLTPHGRWWLRCHIFCYVLWPVVLPDAILLGKADMVLLIKICLLEKRTRKSELIQTVAITKSCNVGKTITICDCVLLRRVSPHTRFTRLTCSTQGYTTLQSVSRGRESSPTKYHSIKNRQPKNTGLHLLKSDQAPWLRCPKTKKTKNIWGLHRIVSYWHEGTTFWLLNSRRRPGGNSGLSYIIVLMMMLINQLCLVGKKLFPCLKIPILIPWT